MQLVRIYLQSYIGDALQEQSNGPLNDVSPPHPKEAPAKRRRESYKTTIMNLIAQYGPQGDHPSMTSSGLQATYSKWELMVLIIVS